MITVAIVAILTVVAIASYEFAVVKTRRAAAKGCITESAQYMERYYTTNFSYADATLPKCSSDVTPYYRVEFSGAPDASTFTIQAVPLNRQASADARCGTLSINQVGTKTATGSDGAQCW
jgi:type IV pilus assembly protein PilE